MRLFLFLTILALAPVARGGTRKHEPIAIKRCAVVNEATTKRARELLRALPSLAPTVAGEQLAELLQGHELPTHDAGPWLELIARVGGPDELRRVYVGLVTALADDCCEGAPGADFDTGLAFATDEMVQRAARTLIDATEKRHVLPASPYLDGRLHLGRHMYWSCPDGMAGDLARLATLYRVTEDYEAVVALLFHQEHHRAAFEALSLLEPDALASAVEETCFQLDNPLSARAALILLARAAPERALRCMARVLSVAMDEPSLADLWTQLLAMEGFREELLESLPPSLPPAVVAAGEKGARQAGAVALAAALHTRASPAAADFGPLAEDARLHGDAAHGELLFRDSHGNCAECHALGGVGRTRGPDLATLAARKSPAEIVSAILQPWAHVSRRYEPVDTGERGVTVFPGTGEPSAPRKYARRPHAEAERGLAGPGAFSDMPSGLTDDFTLQELRDLLAFLLQLGAPGGLDAANPHLARQWRIEADSSTRPGGSINRHQPTGGTSEVTSLIDGRLRREDCLDALSAYTELRRFYVATYFDVPAAGSVRLTLTGVAQAWLDGKPVPDPAAAEVSLDLSKGEHRLDIRLEAKEMPRFVRVSSPDARFSTEPLYPERQ